MPEKKTLTKPLFQKRVGNVLFKAFEWDGTTHYQCLRCPLLPCASKPDSFPSCLRTENQFHKNLRWEAERLDHINEYAKQNTAAPPPPPKRVTCGECRHFVRDTSGISRSNDTGEYFMGFCTQDLHPDNCLKVFANKPRICPSHKPL